MGCVMTTSAAAGIWPLVWLLATVIVLAGAVLAVLRLAPAVLRPPGRTQPDAYRPVPPDAAEAVLRRRYAAGQIDREEYLQRKVDLEP